MVMKPPTTKKELHMEITNEDDGSDFNNMETFETNNVDVEEKWGASSENGEHLFPYKKRKVVH